MSYDPFYHVRVRSIDLTLWCCGPNCEREVQGIEIYQDGLELLGDVVAQIELDNGWENGMCPECFGEAELEAFSFLKIDWDTN
jgi:hypothetical protein